MEQKAQPTILKDSLHVRENDVLWPLAMVQERSGLTPRGLGGAAPQDSGMYGKGVGEAWGVSFSFLLPSVLIF